MKYLLIGVFTVIAAVLGAPLLPSVSPIVSEDCDGCEVVAQEWPGLNSVTFTIVYKSGYPASSVDGECWTEEPPYDCQQKTGCSPNVEVFIESPYANGQIKSTDLDTSDVYWSDLDLNGNGFVDMDDVTFVDMENETYDCSNMAVKVQVLDGGIVMATAEVGCKYCL